MNPHYGDFDPYHMAASAIDEAVRNCVAVGADPTRIALLDNFCWGDCERPETLGALVRAAIACHDMAVELGTPFISGKDSLNNEFSFTDKGTGERQTIAIPPTLLISAVGQVDDAAKCVTMDLKSPGNLLYVVGLTKNEMAGSHWQLLTASGRADLAASGGGDLASGGGDLASGRREPAVTDEEQETADNNRVPAVDAPLAKRTFAAVHAAIQQGFVRACHDLSEGGLAVAAAEMCFAGGLGAEIELATVPNAQDANDATVLLFSESNSRFLCEVPPDESAAFEGTLAEVPHAKIGTVTDAARLRIHGQTGGAVVDADVETLKQAWKQPFAW